MNFILAAIRPESAFAVLLSMSTVVAAIGWLLMFFGLRCMYCSVIKMLSLGGTGFCGLRYPDGLSHNEVCFHLIQYRKLPRDMLFQIFTWRYPLDTYDPKVDYIKLYRERKL